MFKKNLCFKAIIPLIATFSTQTHITFVLTQDNYFSILSARGPGKNKSIGIYICVRNQPFAKLSSITVHKVAF